MRSVRESNKSMVKRKGDYNCSHTILLYYTSDGARAY